MPSNIGANIGASFSAVHSFHQQGEGTFTLSRGGHSCGNPTESLKCANAEKQRSQAFSKSAGTRCLTHNPDLVVVAIARMVS
jgi:hypothetical protein